MAKKPKVFLFDDDKKERPLIAKELSKVFRGAAEIIEFPGGSRNRDKTFESLLLEDLATEFDIIKLILCDQDLSTMDGYEGLSANTVTTVAREEGLSIGIYGRGKSDEMANRIRQKRHFLERRFFLDIGDKFNMHSFSVEAYGLFLGCIQITDYVETKIFNNFKKPIKIRSGNPASLMSDLLERNSIQTRLSLYGSGDQQYLEPLATLDAVKDPEKAARIISSELGYWLWESILRFPGVLLNAVATASFLNIDADQFEKSDVKKLFNSALYTGPFGRVSSHWWRDGLQEILEKKNCKSGLEFAKKSGYTNIRRCKCSVDSKEDAGYYCMLSNKPVSLKHSVGKIPYFPAGADLARIATGEFEKVAPWAGLES